MAAVTPRSRSVEASPSVGVMLTTYNGAAFVREQLESLLHQVGVSLHVYVFDDGSTDDTLSVLGEFAADHPGLFSIFENAPGYGGTGLNICCNLRNVVGDHDYVALADQDDFWLPNKLQRAVEALSRERAGLYFSNLLAWDGKDRILGVVKRDTPPQAHDHLFGGGSAGCTYVMSRHLFTRLQEVFARTDVGGVRRISHDWIIYFLARHYGYQVCASSDALIRYRVHSSSQYGGMSLGGFGAMRRKLRMVRDGFLREQIDNALRFAREGTEDRAILLACKRGRRSRLAMLLKYRFSLVRSKSRLFLLAAALLAGSAMLRPEGHRDEVG
jgi:rhamnosyltransferase